MTKEEAELYFMARFGDEGRLTFLEIFNTPKTKKEAGLQCKRFFHSRIFETERDMEVRDFWLQVVFQVDVLTHYNHWDGSLQWKLSKTKP